MTTQERAAIYEHCARMVSRAAAESLETGDPWDAVNVLQVLAARIREHKADPVKYP